MKCVYTCEKCGKMFDDLHECMEHEGNHWDVVRGWTDRAYDEILEKETEYKPGDWMAPTRIAVQLYRWPDSGKQYIMGIYKLVQVEDMPEIPEDAEN